MWENIFLCNKQKIKNPSQKRSEKKKETKIKRMRGFPDDNKRTVWTLWTLWISMNGANKEDEPWEVCAVHGNPTKVTPSVAQMHFRSVFAFVAFPVAANLRTRLSVKVTSNSHHDRKFFSMPENFSISTEKVKHIWILYFYSLEARRKFALFCTS